jgi:hypothetical protein
MVPGRGPCSDTTGKTESSRVELLCQWRKAIATDLSRSEIEGVNCEDTEAEMDDRNGEHSRAGEAHQRLVTSRRKLTQ